MKFSRFCTGLVCTILASAPAWAETVGVEDAYARSNADGTIWTIGAASIQESFECSGGVFKTSRILNGAVSAEPEYKGEAAPFGITTAPVPGPFARKSDGDAAVFFSADLQPGGSLDLSVGRDSVTVKQGDVIAFSARVGGDSGGALLDWPLIMEYADGERSASTDDPNLGQGPIWFYYISAPGTDCMDLMGETLQPDPASPDKVRVPEGYRSSFECPRLGGSMVWLLNGYELTRVWKAPKDGVVTLKGTAAHKSGNASVTLCSFRVVERSAPEFNGLDAYNGWSFESGKISKTTVGGRPAAQLDLALSRDGFKVALHVQAHPRTSILRQWVEIENAGAAPARLETVTPFSFIMNDTRSTSRVHYWMRGGTSTSEQGMLESADIGEQYHRCILGEKTDNFVPWTAIMRKDDVKDGLFVTLDWLGTWTLSTDRMESKTSITASLPGLANRMMTPGERLKLPVVTLGAFSGDLDDMGRRVYNWQYEYMWDFTNMDYFARVKWTTPWFFCSRNLQEQFAARLAGLDMDADLMRSLGIEMMWDDAGWSRFPSWPIPDSYVTVFCPTFEGPDYAESLRYLSKMDMKWLVWTAGRPNGGLIASKVGAWGNFQWRTDGVGRFDLAGEQAFRARIERFLTENPGCSFHTCDGGSRYAHEFEIQRYADVNYLSDGGRGLQTNHYFSYLELPDKWLDSVYAIEEQTRYNPDTAWAQLSMAPSWYCKVAPDDVEPFRILMEMYRYLRREGVVGRWSYMLHPRVDGDSEIYYDQRISHDRTKSVLIVKHKPAGEVVIYPKRLLPDYSYSVSFGIGIGDCVRTGADLVKNGVSLKVLGSAGGLVRLGLPTAPGTGVDKTPPSAPGMAFQRREVNIGHPGVGVYWSPSVDGLSSANADDGWISYYEISRDGATIGKASVGDYYFDHATGWNADATYAVRAVDGDGNASDWVNAAAASGGQDAFSALGGLFADAGRDGWSAETLNADGAATSMTFTPPVKNPAGDFGGTPNQVGGVEGYWEGGGARIGRAWQSASTSVSCARVWIAPKPGKLRITGRAMREFYHAAMGGALSVKITRNDAQVWPESGWATVPANDRYGVAHDLELNVEQGDKIRFILGPGSDPESDILAWTPRLTYQTDNANSEGASVRIRCGASSAYVDRNGNVWDADKFYAGGKAVDETGEIADASPTREDAGLYLAGRSGADFTYSIPVKQGLYSVRLKFAETEFSGTLERPMNVYINGERRLENFDVVQAARSSHRAYERLFSGIVPNRDGMIVIRFTGGFEPTAKSGEAVARAIEILPENRNTIRIDCGADAQFVDWNGYAWSADAFFKGGAAKRFDAETAQATPTLYDQSLYQTARVGRSFHYEIPAAPGVYSVHLKFAELEFKEPGRRGMNIIVNGRIERRDWDPAAAAEQVGAASDVRIFNVTPNKDNLIVIDAAATGEADAALDAIEIE
jgi:hypothetical protein